MAMMGGVLVALVIYFIVAILLGAVMLRLSISLANRFLGESPGQVVVQGFSNPGAAPIDPDNPFSAPQVQEVAVAGGIPSPTYGRACVILLAQMAGGFIASFGVGIVIGLGLGADGAAQALSFVIILPLNGLVLSGMLPTTFGRGMLIILCQAMIGIGLVIVVAIIVGGLAAVFGA